jgi:hypothetical protein
MWTYVVGGGGGGEVDVYKKKYDADKLSFFEVERIVKTYGYKPGDLMYYLVPSSSLQSGLKLISSNHDVVKMVDVHQDVSVGELYLVSFVERRPNEMIVWLMMKLKKLKLVGMVGLIEMIHIEMKSMNLTCLIKIMRLVGHPLKGGIDGEGGEGDEDDENNEDFKHSGEDSGEENEDAGDKVVDDGSIAGDDNEVENDGQNSDMAQSDILTSPPKSDEEDEVVSQPACRPRHYEFHPFDLHNT